MWKAKFALFLFAASTLAATEPPQKYLLGPGDMILVQVVGMPEFTNQPYRIDVDGTISLPLLGRVRAGGLTLADFETEVVTALKKQVLHPHVITSLATPRGEPVSVLGAVNSPGTQQIQGRKTLFDVLAAAGGVKPDAGNTVTITRIRSEGPLDLPNAAEDPATGRLTAAVNLNALVNLREPSANILVRPHDEISVPRAQLIYVIGNVRKAGGFTLSEGRSISALEALSLAEGLSPNASPKSARILRKHGADREQIPVNLKAILAGKTKDVALNPDDILFVPDNVSRRATTRALETAMNTLSGVAIWRGF